jgi:hypothetical protein
LSEFFGMEIRMATVNIQKSYSALNEKLVHLFDESGVRRAFTVPYIQGQEMHEHVDAVGQAAQQSGGLGSNLVVTAHHSDGKGYGSGDGHTVGHPVEKLRTTIIPKADEKAKDVIDAAQSHLNKLAKLLGDDAPEIQAANHQLALVKQTDGAGMNLLDFGTMMTQLMFRPTQAVARAHSGTKEGGHSPQLRAPGGASTQEDQSSQSQPAGEGEGEETDQSATPAPPAAPAAPQPQGGPAGANPQG